MFPSSLLNNVPSSSTSCKSVREPDERCVATGPLQLTAKKATTIKKATANVLLLSILLSPYHVRCFWHICDAMGDYLNQYVEGRTKGDASRNRSVWV